jgi:hypothetical protein
MTRHRTEFSPVRSRATAFGMALVVTLAVLAGLGGIADQQVDAALLAQARTSATQVVVITGHRLPRG